jgi:hypothetical protein
VKTTEGVALAAVQLMNSRPPRLFVWNVFVLVAVRAAEAKMVCVSFKAFS